MNDYIRNKYMASGKQKKTGGSAVLYVLLFIAFTALIVGLMIAWEKEQRRARAAEQKARELEEYHRQVNGATDSNGGNRIVEFNGSDRDYVSRGLKPNNPAHSGASSTKDATKTSIVHPKPKALYVGRKDHDRYHRPDCKYGLAHIEPENLVEFFSASEAREGGYIPCKICRPPAMDEGPAVIVRTDNSKPGSDPPPPRHTVSQPITIAVKDVPIDFEYNVLERTPTNDEGVVIVEYIVEVERVLAKEDALKVAQKIVAAELEKGKVNAVNVTVRKRATSSKGLKWFCVIDWAPYGNLTRAYEIKRGDYKTHQFSILMQGIYQR